MLFLLMVLEVWAVVSTATHSKFSHFGDNRVPHKPLLDGWHIVFGSNDCRMVACLCKPRTFIAVYPAFEGVSSPCVRIGKHSVQNLDGVAEGNYQRVLSCAHCLSSLSLRFNHPSRNRLHSSKVGFTQENNSPSVWR